MSCSSEGCSTSAPGRQPERVLGEITDITLFSPGKKKNNRGDHLQLQLITADCVAAAQVPGNQEIGDNAIRALFSTFPPPYLNLKPSWPRDREGEPGLQTPDTVFPSLSVSGRWPAAAHKNLNVFLFPRGQAEDHWATWPLSAHLSCS